jgi:predicted dehydrogenase
MPLSWNEIKSRASYFSNEWKDTKREEADAKPFLIDFLNIFGISQKRVATFEHRVKKIDEASGYIDLLWPGTLLVEMKSRGQDLEKAYTQAKNYCHGLKDHELPKLIMICDFHHFHIYREDGLAIKFELTQLLDNLQIFEELAGYQKRTYHEEDPVNIAAAELMGKLHDQLKEVGYTGSPLEAYLVRLLFILFADDTTIFQKGIFFDYLEQRTKEDGSDLAMHLDQLFQVLDIPEDKRLKTLDEQLNIFPYVNGRLFTERLPTAAFNSNMRQILLDCCKHDWGKISPAIFGSLFQSVMDTGARRNLGAHYTSEKNIMKLIKPLFLDELWDEFHAAGENQNKLKELHRKISKLRFLDPACGCGNFLITAYRELRQLELAIVEKLLKGQLVTNINQYFLVDLDQFYGIELGEFPSQIAQVAMFLIDHQCNMMVSDRFGEYIPLIPLQKSAVIVNDNALRVDWQSIIKPLEGETELPRLNYILGNPPFLGKHVYCEKPMVYKISEGYPVMEAAKKYGKVLQVGSQRVSSIGYAKAKELLAAGEIGKLNMVNAVYDRQSSIGAWEYTIPKDANAMTTNWDKFIEVTEKMNFDAKKFFWWRAFKEVGTGVAGDLFIHLLSGTHFMTNSLGPETIYSTGQFSYWNDGRNMPDVMSGVMQYPKAKEHDAFQMTLQVNFISGTGGQEIIKLVGSEGTIEVNGNNLTIKHSLMPQAPGFGGYDSLFTFSKSMQDEMQKDYNAKWNSDQRKKKTKEDILFKAPEGYNDHLDHFTNFFDSVRTGKQVVEDATFGFRAAAPALSCNESYFTKKIVQWDPVEMKLK